MTFRFQYGDYSAQEGLAHLAVYRAFQAWLIAKHLGIPFHLPSEIIAGMNEHVVPHADQWRGFGVFPPAIQPLAGADDETLLLCAVGWWTPRVRPQHALRRAALFRGQACDAGLNREVG